MTQSNLVVPRSGVVEAGFWKGVWEIEQYREGRLIHHEINHNLLTTQGKRYIVDMAMKGATTPDHTLHTAWFVALSGTSETASVGMTYATKGFTEFVDYVEGVRQPWAGVLDGSAASMTNNASKATFNIVTPVVNLGVVYGAGLVTLDTKGNSVAGDYLLNYSKFATMLTVSPTYIIKIGVTITLT